MQPYVTKSGMLIIAKFENCDNIEQVKEAMPKKVAKLIQDGHLPSITKYLQENVEAEK